ncbi:MAG: hypothetical protein AAFR31_16295 [Cyanobacteria bacterium J06627_8]
MTAKSRFWHIGEHRQLYLKGSRQLYLKGSRQLYLKGSRQPSIVKLW